MLGLGMQMSLLAGGAVETRSGPVQLVIDWVEEQQSFNFKWKAPSTSTLVFNWGDGSTSEVVGQDAVEVTTSKIYGGTAEYNFWITGDVLDLTYIDIRSQAFVSGDVSPWIQLINLDTIYFNSTGVDGSIAGYGVLTNLIILWGFQTNITGSIEGLTALTSMISMNLSTTAITGNSALLFTMTSATLIALQSTSVTFDTTPAWVNSSATIRLDSINNGGATSTMVDNMIESLSTCTNSTMNVAGNNDHRTAASNDDLNTLYANGNSITLNDVLSAELVVNGDLTNWTEPGQPNDFPDNWTLAGNDANNYISDNGGKVDITTNGANLRIFQVIATATKIYRLEGTPSGQTGGNMSFTVAGGVGGAGTATISTNGAFVYYLVATSTFFLIGFSASDTGALLDDVSLKEVTFP